MKESALSSLMGRRSRLSSDMAALQSLWQGLLTLLTPRWSRCVLTELSSLNICFLCLGLPVAQELGEPQLGIPTVSGAASMKNKEKEDKCLSPSITPWWGQLRQAPCNPPEVPQGSGYHSNLPFPFFPHLPSWYSQRSLHK